MSFSKEKFLELARKNSGIGVEYILRGAFSKSEYVPLGEVHYEINEMIDKAKKDAELVRLGVLPDYKAKTGVLIHIPREHLKTTISLCRVLWELGNNPDLTIKIINANEEQAKKRVAFLRTNIERNRNLKKLFPHLRQSEGGDSWSKTQLYVQRKTIKVEPSVEACAVLGHHTGSHADILIFDDIIDYKSAFVYPSQLDLIAEAVRHNWLNILNKDGFFIMIYTAWTERDITLQMEKQTNLYYVYTRFVDDDLNPVWKERYDKEALRKKRDKIGHVAFARHFQGKVVAPKSKTFNSNSIEKAKDYSIEFGEYPEKSKLFMGVDLGHRTKKTSPKTSIFTLAITPDGKRLPVSIKVGSFSSTDTARIIISEYLKYHHELIAVETNGYQQSLLEWIQILDKDLILPIEGIFTTAPSKHSETSGIPAMATEFDRGLWILPFKGMEDHQNDCNCVLCEFVRQLDSYPYGLTDIVMSAWFALTIYKRNYASDLMDVNIRVLRIIEDSNEAQRFII